MLAKRLDHALIHPNGAVVSPTIIMLTEYIPCVGCSRLLRPIGVNGDEDPGEAFYRAANGRYPYCLACWNGPRKDLPTFGMRNAMAVAASR